MKRLLLVLGLAATAGFSLAQRQTTFNFQFPYFAAVYTNVTQVDFFTDDYNGSAALGPSSTDYYSNGTFKTNDGTNTYYVADQKGLVACLDDNLTLPSQVQVQNTAGNNSLSTSISCDFVPNKVVDGQGFSVTGYTNIDANARTDNPTDGELLIITNVDPNSTNNTFGVNATVSGTVPNGTLYVSPGFVLSDFTLKAKTNSSWKSLNNSTSSLFTKSDAYSTNYAKAFVIPLTFKYTIDDVLSASANTNAQVTVTWEGYVQ